MPKDLYQNFYILKIYDGSTIMIQKSSVNTLLDLKLIVQEHKNIQPKNQRLVINSKVIKAHDNLPVQNLQISKNDLLNVYTKQKNSDKKQQPQQRALQIIEKLQISPVKQDQVQYISQQSVQITQALEMKQLQQFFDKAKNQKNWMISSSSQIQQFCFFLWKQGISQVTSVLFNEQLQNRLIQSFIKLNIFKENRKYFLSNTQFLKFVCQKIAFVNSNLKQLPNFIKRIQIQLYQPEPSLTQKQISKLKSKISLSRDQQLVQELQKLGFDKQRAQNTIQLSQNNLLKAIQYLTFNQKVFEIQVKIPLQKLDQCKFLYSWFMKPQHTILRLKLAASQKYLDLYTLSMKHKSTQFYNLLLSQRRYVFKLIKENKPNLYNS